MINNVLVLYRKPAGICKLLPNKKNITNAKVFFKELMFCGSLQDLF